MWNSIKRFMIFLNWGWFSLVVMLAAVLVALFPFNIISFGYITSPPVVMVMIKTVLIAIPTIINVGLAAYFIYHRDLWTKNVSAAIAVHVLWGMVFSFMIVSWMIRLLYSGSIGLDPNHQSDIIFAGALLLTLNFWMRTRIAVTRKKDMANAMVVHQEHMADISLENIELKKSVAYCTEELEGLRKKWSALEKETEERLDHNTQLQHNKKARYLEIKYADHVAILSENEVAYAEVINVEGKYSYQVMDRDKVVYYAPVQSLHNLADRYFTGMLLVSRKFGVMPHAVLDYSKLGEDSLWLHVLHREEPIEVSGVYYKRYKEHIIDLVHKRKNKTE